MTEKDVRKIEKKTKTKLPQHYLDLVTNYPSELANTEAPDFALLDDPKEVISMNRFVRKHGACGAPWPSKYFIIGHNGCGDYYLIMHEATCFSVGFADHEKAEIHKFADTREEFVQKLLQEQEEE